jgi:hypothetical protein
MHDAASPLAALDWAGQLGLRFRAVRPARPEAVLYWGVTAVVALHAAVDSFVAPEPGTGPGDHVLRGAVSLALLALAAAAYPRLPAGGRAAIATTLGALAV